MTNRRAELGVAAVFRFIAGVAVTGAVLFLAAGTLDYWQAWVYLVVLFGPLALLGVALWLNDPDLLERRMKTRETDPRQRRAIAVAGLGFSLSILVAAVDRRFAWSGVPAQVVVIADLLILLGLTLTVLTIRENRFASRVVEVQEGQTVVSTGPYSLVRHPMYLGVGLMCLFSPLALASYWGLLPALTFPLGLAARLANEEHILRRSLAGYDAYTRTVRYRLLPFVW
jgi:protein-S-isoprenylcysteine O-methyltransferase Ste14